jgi:phage-related protein
MELRKMPSDGALEKPINWRGSSLDDIKDDRIFSADARRQAGHQLGKVQAGLDPDDWRPFDEVGRGTKEIRIALDDGWFRVMYVAKFSEAVYVLHCFRKKTNATTNRDKEIAAARYKAVIRERGCR